MAAQIKLKKLSDIWINDNKVVMAISTGKKETVINDAATGIKALANNGKIVFAGQDYKGTFTAGTSFATDKKGELELYLERPENHFTIKDVKINTAGAHEYKCTGKICEAKIDLTTSTPTITEQDSGWFTTELKGTASSLKFGEWNDFDLSDKCYVNIDFA